VLVRVPKATVFTVPAYALDLEVFRPGWLWFDHDSAEGITGLGCVAQALDYARAHPDSAPTAELLTEAAGRALLGDEVSFEIDL